ncbi:YkgJ family cysteine cluster protein [Sphingomonas sp.]|uniref:YkgJ family cysteine cluster protein n=1 Tax=Sphingomonas sp. TaxID=28214 RepID=UPI003CC563DA
MTPPARPAPRTVHLSVDPALHRDLVTATVDLTAGGEPLRLSITIPAGRVTAEDLLPVLQELSSLFSRRGEAAVARAGKAISCCAGCGACCRQMVPVAGAEARQLARLVAAMPEPRRSAVRARFAAALATLDAAGLLARIEDAGTITAADQGMAYFRLGIPCPFLEDEACSIHPDRPLGCREYLVTSPPAKCADTDARAIDRVPVAWQVSHSLIATPAGEGWMPLVLALRWAGRAGPAKKQLGPELLAAIFAAASPA